MRQLSRRCCLQGAWKLSAAVIDADGVGQGELKWET